MSSAPEDLEEPVSRRWVLPVVLVVVLALVGGFAWVGYQVLDAGAERIAVRVVANGVDEEVEVAEGDLVADVLAEAGVATHDGRLLSVRDHEVLDEHVDPAAVTVNGRPGDRDTILAEGAEVEVVDGKDVIEGTEEITDALPAAPYPEVLRHVHERGRPGEAVKVVGVTSREIVSRTTTREPVDPIQTTRKVVALTFDDGPTEQWTPQILAILAAKGVKATFCQVGENVDRRPELVEQVVAAGHQLCNHTLNHDEGLRDADQARLDAQIGGGRQAFLDHDLPDPPYYRPPGGFLSDAITATAAANDEQQILWKVDTEDWKRDANVLTVARHVLDQVDAGAIILLHDGGGATRQATVDILGPLIDYLRAAGYEFTFPITDPA